MTQFYRHPVAMVSSELLVTIIFIIILAVVAIQPTLKTMSELSKEIEDKTELNEKLQSKIASLNTAQAEFYRWQSQIELLDTAIPNNDATLLDLKLVEKVAFESNVVISRLSLGEYPDATKPLSLKPKVNDLPVNITVQGDYLSIKKFVDSILNSRRVYIISAITFSVSTDRGGEQSLSASITMNAPYYQ